MNRIAVVGATGTIGREVVSQLVAAGAAVQAMSRNPDDAALPGEVEVRRGDLTVPETLDASIAGADALFLVWTAPYDTAPAAIARIAKQVRRVVLLTSPHSVPHPLFQQTNPLARMHAEMERLIIASGMRWTFLRPGMFASNAVAWWGSQIRAGNVVRWPYGSAPTAPIHERDVAAVAVRALLDESHDGAEYVITGPESLEQREQVEIIGEEMGKALRLEEITQDEARRELPFPPAALDMLLKAWAAAVGQPALVTSTVEQVTGTPARSFRQWARDHAGDFAG